MTRIIYLVNRPRDRAFLLDQNFLMGDPIAEYQSGIRVDKPDSDTKPLPCRVGVSPTDSDNHIENSYLKALKCSYHTHTKTTFKRNLQ